MVVFTAIGAYVTLIDPNLSSSAVKLAADTGVLAISLVSMIGRTLHPAICDRGGRCRDGKVPGFMKATYIITWAWTRSMLLMMAGNVALIYVPGLPLWSGLLIAFAARNSAIYFTRWYPQYRKAKYGMPPASALPGTD